MSYLYPQIKILLFTKPPVTGQCKTRLIPALGKEGAATLQQKLLHKIIQDLLDFKLCPFEVWQSDDSDYFSQLNFADELNVKTQSGDELGARMANAFKDNLAGNKKVIIIGSDCVEYTRAYLANAITALLDNEVVIGPAHDGGYLLIGMSKFQPIIFDNIEWGTDNVLESTLQKLKKANVTYSQLNTLHDIDRPEDLAYLNQVAPELLSNN